MEEIAPKYASASAHLEEAARHFGREADTLDRCEGFLSWGAKELSPEDHEAAAKLLAQARSEYSEGIEAIEKALSVL